MKSRDARNLLLKTAISLLDSINKNEIVQVHGEDVVMGDLIYALECFLDEEWQ